MVANLVGQTVRLHTILAADRQRLLDERHQLEKALGQELAEKGRLPTPKIMGIVGESQPLKRVLETIAIVAKSNSTVLLRGESGTGKELFARAIHDLSARKGKPFVKLNCAALPESVLESELFGHEKGSFTAQVGQRAGRSRARTAVRCSSTRSARSRRTSGPSSCACCRRASSSASAAIAR